MSNKMKEKLIRIKEKFNIIKHVLRSGQYAFYSINSDYVNGKETPKRSACYFSDNSTKKFLECIIIHTNNKLAEYE